MCGDLRHTGLDDSRLERITDYLERAHLVPQRMAGCQIAIRRRGRQAYLRTFGSMDLARGRDMREDTIFRIYSMTKQITAVALMTLYEQGLFQLNDPVSEFVPSWKDLRVWVSGEGDCMVTRVPNGPVTFRDLLCHTAGLIYAVGWPGVPVQHPVEKIYRDLDIRVASSNDTAAQFLAKLSHAPLIHDPGSAWTYSVASDVCGALVELISGKPFDQYLHDELFGPLGMKDTSFHVSPEKLDRFGSNYIFGPDLRLTVLPDDPRVGDFTHHHTYRSGGGGLTSTTEDFMKFCEMLRRAGYHDRQRILSPRTIAMMHMNHLPGGKSVGELTSDPYFIEHHAGVGFGLGFYVSQGVVDSGALGGASYGGGGAASTFFWVDPKEALSVVFMSQRMPNDHAIRAALRTLIYSAMVD